MKLLLDTHVILWSVLDDPKLPGRIRTAMTGRDVALYVSAASVWEVAIKRALGKLDVPDDLWRHVRAAGAIPLAVTWDHAEAVQALPLHHTDPFDRLLIAQARSEGLTLVSLDQAMALYDVARI
ncbi:MAG: type II toxin-antitoxin system VapC family toxin [Pseudomonadota bacterium]